MMVTRSAARAAQQVKAVSAVDPRSEITNEEIVELVAVFGGGRGDGGGAAELGQQKPQGGCPWGFVIRGSGGGRVAPSV